MKIGQIFQFFKLKILYIRVSPNNSLWKVNFTAFYLPDSCCLFPRKYFGIYIKEQRNFGKVLPS